MVGFKSAFKAAVLYAGFTDLFEEIILASTGDQPISLSDGKSSSNPFNFYFRKKIMKNHFSLQNNRLKAKSLHWDTSCIY